MAYSRRATIFDVTTRRPGKPSAGDARNDALRAIVRAIVATDHGGVQRPAAASIGVTASALNDFLNGLEYVETVETVSDLPEWADAVRGGRRAFVPETPLR